MATNYPAGFDSFVNPTGGNQQSSPSHAGQHVAANDAIAAIQATLGLNPQGGSATLKDSLTTALRPSGRFQQRVWGQNMLWGGVSGHPYTSGGVGSTFNTNDTSTFAIGDRSISMTTPGNGVQATMVKLNGTAVDMTGRCPRIWFKVDNYAAVSDLRLWMGSGGALANAYKWQLTDGAANRLYADGEWVSWILPWSKVTTVGTPVRTALTDTYIQVIDNSTAPLVFHWGGLATVPDNTTRFPNGVVSLSFDDNYLSVFTQARPYMDKYGMYGTAYIICDLMSASNHTSLAQLVQLRDQSGWEFGLHSYTIAQHDAGFTTLTTAQRIANIRSNREFLLSNGFPVPDSFAYPLGDFNQQTSTDLRPFVGSARTTNSKWPNESWPPSDRMKLVTRPIGNTDTAATINALIDVAQANKEWLILTFHDINTSPTQSTATTITIFQSIIDHIAASSIAVRTVGDVMATAPNLAG